MYCTCDPLSRNGIVTQRVQGKEKKEMMKVKALNTHKLPKPIEDEVVYGDIIVFRNDMDAEPIDLPLNEWEDFVKVPGPALFPTPALSDHVLLPAFATDTPPNCHFPSGLAAGP